jgi:hypothetical protein
LKEEVAEAIVAEAHARIAAEAAEARRALDGAAVDDDAVSQVVDAAVSEAADAHPTPGGDQGAHLLVAYWDIGTCGPLGDDANWEWCEKDKFQCKPEVAFGCCGG